METTEITRGSPLLVYNQPEREYRQAEGINQSSMKPLLVSGAHYIAEHGPDAPYKPSTANMLLGTALHTLVLEGDEFFASAYCDRSQAAKDPTVPELKALLKEREIEFKSALKKDELLALAYPDGLPKDPRESLSGDDYAACLGMAESLRTHDITGPWFNPEQEDYRQFNEVGIYAVTEQGVLIKGRLDRVVFLPEERIIRIVDIKTTDDARPAAFQRTASQFFYDLQAHWYRTITEQAFALLIADGWTVEFIFAVVERKRPHGVQVYRASRKLLESGARKMAVALDRLSSFQELDFWPGYDPQILDLDPPAWTSPVEAVEVDL